MKQAAAMRGKVRPLPRTSLSHHPCLIYALSPRCDINRCTLIETITKELTQTKRNPKTKQKSNSFFGSVCIIVGNE